MTSQKVSTSTISMKQKREITNPKADICLKTDGENCLIKYNGHTVELADLVFTAMKQDDTMAAIICQTARDFVQSLKIDVRAWKALTANCAEVSRQLVSRAGGQTTKPRLRTAPATAPVTDQTSSKESKL
jgi:hypothetical protein